MMPTQQVACLSREQLLRSFSDLYWLKPYDIPWDAITAWHVAQRIGPDDAVLDLGCGDGLFSALMFGGRLAPETDRFVAANAQHQAIRAGQEGDIYTQSWTPRLTTRPTRAIDEGLELKAYHLRIAESLGIYDHMTQGAFETHALSAERFDAVFSVFALYWADNLGRSLDNVHRVLKAGGRLLVTLPSEHLRGMHLARQLADANRDQEPIGRYFDTLDGGRCRLTTRYANSPAAWDRLLSSHGFDLLETIPVVNKLLFTMQDLTHRPLLPVLIAHANRLAPDQRLALKQYLCDIVYPEWLTQFYDGLEGRADIEHAYYLFHLRKR